MSIWSDIQERSAGTMERKEDCLPMAIDLRRIGGGTKFPTQFPVPDNVRMQKFFYLLCPEGDEGTYIRAEYLVWAYKLRHPNLNEFGKILKDILDEFGDFTYHPNKETISERLSDKSKRMIKELRDRVSKHNEEVCGIPLWTDNSEPSIIDDED